jgi:hypothetical protein
MQRIDVEFGRATFFHNREGIELIVRVDASLQSSCPQLSRTVSIDAAALPLLNLWVRPRRPLVISFAISFENLVDQLCLDFLSVREELKAILSSATVCRPTIPPFKDTDAGSCGLS